jgi:hypothetical protein
MSARDDVLEAVGAVVAVWRRTLDHVPDDLDDAIIDLKQAVEAMNARPHARATDPATSRQGPDAGNMTRNRALVLELLRQRARTDEELVQALAGQMSASGARTRRAELVRSGLVADTGTRRKSQTGRSHKVWKAV